MAFISELRQRVESLATGGSLEVDARELPAVVASFDDDELLALMTEAAAVGAEMQKLQVLAAGVLDRRSTRERGQGGLAATRGFRRPSELVQAISGGTKAEAERQVRLGAAIIGGLEGGAGVVEGGSGSGLVPASGSAPASGLVPASGSVPVVARWDEGLQRAMLSGTISAAQHDAIFRGLGEPVVRVGAASGVDAASGDAAVSGDVAAAGDAADAEAAGVAAGVADAAAAGDAAASGVAAAAARAAEVWGLAAERLVRDAEGVTPEALLARARAERDTLDPEGASERFAQRYERRSFRMWTDADGARRASMSFDDEMAAWVRAITDAALRPRRGGPRFVDEQEKAAAQALTDDPRTNDQLTYDLMVGMWRAGALASAADVFGARQPGVRLIVVDDLVGPRDPAGRLLAAGHTEDRGDALPGPIIERQLCESGHVEVTVDSCGNPLDVGREQRLFTPKQRIALAARDGGCVAVGCIAPASYCEAHHIDQWVRDTGRTDIDRGILLCRFHHMQLHHHGWRITRRGKGAFILHRPPEHGGPIELRSKSAVKWAWNPPPPDRPTWREASSAGPPG